MRQRANQTAEWIRIVLTALAAAMAGCDRQPSAPEGQPMVAATIYPLASMVKELAGDAVTVRTLVPAGMSAHGFEPTASDFSALRSAKLVAAVGMGYDDWALSQADAKRLVRMSDQAGGHDHERHESGKHDDHHHHDQNPHLWLDPVRMAEFVERKLAPALSKLLGRAVDAGPLLASLRELDEAHRQALAPHQGKRFITYHNAFDLLAERYGLGEVITLTPIDSPASVTPARLREAIEAVKERGIRAVFVEQQFPRDVGALLERQAGVVVRVLDTQGDPHDPSRDTYLKMMRRNLAEITAGLAESTGR